MKKISNKKLQELCDNDPQLVANELNESIVYHFFEDKFYTESQYKKECEKTALKYKSEFTDEIWEKEKSWDILTWFHPQDENI